MSFDSMLPITDAIIYQPTETSDGAGGFDIVYSTKRVAAYKCRIYSPVGEVEITQSGENVLIKIKCIGEYFAGITENDLLVNGSDTYRIVQVNKVYGRSAIHHLEMKLQKENISVG